MLLSSEINYARQRRLDPDDFRHIDIKTGKCVTKDGKKRQLTVVYSRVSGYFSPISEYNIGKKQEFKDRKFF